MSFVFYSLLLDNFAVKEATGICPEAFVSNPSDCLLLCARNWLDMLLFSRTIKSKIVSMPAGLWMLFSKGLCLLLMLWLDSKGKKNRRIKEKYLCLINLLNQKPRLLGDLSNLYPSKKSTSCYRKIFNQSNDNKDNVT